MSVNTSKIMNEYSLFPSEVANKTEHWNKKQNEVKDTVRPYTGDNALIFGRKSDSGCNDSVKR
jgi:hypothetical protein